MSGKRALHRELLAAALVLAACAEVDTGPRDWVYDGPVNACGSDGDCAAGSCDPELGACAVSPPSDATLLARVVPDPETGAPPQVFPVDPQAGSLADALRVRTPVVVVGETLVGGGSATSPLTGRIVFADVGNRLPGRPAPVTVYEAENDNSTFDLDLVPSTYNIVVVPEGQEANSIPIYYLDGVVLDTTGTLRDADGDPMDVVAPFPAAQVSGVITQGGVPADGLEVVAFDPETGRIVSTAAESTFEVYEEDDDSNNFSIGLSKAVVDAKTPFSLRISRPAEPHHPLYEIADLTPPDADGMLALGYDPRLALAALEVPVRFQAKVLKPAKTLAGETAYDTAPSCFVVFSSEDVAGGSVEKWVLTNESGELEETDGIPGVYLYQGDYAITVIPAFAPTGSTSDYAAYTSTAPTPIHEDNDAGDVELLLDWRPTVKGEVTAGGDSVPTSAVSAEPAVGAPYTARSNSALSGSTGSFRFWLDAAPYVVVAEAPVESRYAWDVAEATVPNGPLDLSLELPLPFVLRGVIAASADQVEPIELGGAVVEWYRVFGGRACAVGRSIADENGGFVALLPP